MEDYERAADLAEIYLNNYSRNLHRVLVLAGYDAFANRLLEATENLGQDVKAHILKEMEDQ